MEFVYWSCFGIAAACAATAVANMIAIVSIKFFISLSYNFLGINRFYFKVVHVHTAVRCHNVARCCFGEGRAEIYALFACGQLVDGLFAVESVSILSLALLLLSRDDLQSSEFVTAMTVATG